MSISAPDPTQQDFQPLFPDETEDAIMARCIGWANEGLDPVADADEWVDTREGGHWRTAITSCVRELARLYDKAGTEVPMSGFVVWSWGTYLDDLAAVWDVVRIAAVPSQGEVTFAGPAGSVIDVGTTLTAVPSTEVDPAPEFSVTVQGTIPNAGGGVGTVDLPILAVDAGAGGDVSAGAITEGSTPLPAGVTVTNAAPTSGGADPETDAALLARVLQATAGKGPGTVADYVRWVMAYPGVGQVKVVPLWNGPGTVMVIASDASGNPLASAMVTGIQNVLDPVAGKGHGQAPIGAIVSVETPTLLPIAVVATGTVYLTGYSWDGSGGTIAVGPIVQAAISQYLLGVVAGDDVVFAHVQGLIATAQGVHDPGVVSVNGATANVAVPLGPPPQVPYLSGYTAN